MFTQWFVKKKQKQLGCEESMWACCIKTQIIYTNPN